MLLIAKFFVVLFFILCMSCFASTQVIEENIEGISNFAQLSEREKDWYHKFQNGIPFFNGWKQISQEIINKFPVTDRKNMKENLKNLGKKIGTEWCKDNKKRKINTDMLRRWGGMLDSAVEKGKKHLSEAIQTVEKEVDDILVNKLASNKN